MLHVAFTSFASPKQIHMYFLYSLERISLTYTITNIYCIETTVFITQYIFAQGNEIEYKVQCRCKSAKGEIPKW